MHKWYLAHCRPREESRALQNLNNQDIEAFYPFVEAQKIVRGKQVSRTEALFPGYIFVRVDLELTSSTTISSTRGIRNLVRFGTLPCVVPSELVYELMCRSDSDELREKLSDIPKCGDRVQISEGPFTGLEAIYQEADGDARAILLLTLLQKETKASIANTDYTRL
ncbi:transcription/translation regulatory transformer protein RfaH [Zobellella iuensis]|uniref:Transcription antitermination protein RfaH n=1 Tax=Zobellella iuensis TaxID=2803811 RepID=A0ABS1QVV7_9GAMM|nr:transcription/translation regulatory transformer protein RfaH [Zobellella iuensis]MBL1379003.1 transcription/translation regulatory transformer protein RfaH [Zobellella iuensis]